MRMFYRKKIKKFFKRNWHIAVVLFLAIIFFVLTSTFNFFTQEYGGQDFVKWTSPDETSNYIFSKLYGQTGNISVEENYNLYTEDVMRPRSFRSDYGTLKPVSFLGIIVIYGKIVSILGYKVLPFLTPFFASLFLIVFYFFVKLFFTKTNALISVFLAAFFPPLFYYTSRSMFHNVLFVCLFVFSLYFLALINNSQIQKKFFDFSFKKQNFQSLLFSSLSGFFLGLAIITRTSESIWLAPVFVLLFIFYHKKIGFLQFVSFLFFVFLGFVPAFYHNQILYGSFFFGGYNEMNDSIVRITQAGTDFVKNFITGEPGEGEGFAKTVGSKVFYFGVHPKHSLKMFLSYFVKMFPWLFYFSSFGVLVYFLNYKKIKKKIVSYFSALFVLSFILVLYYGSWEFHDNPNPQEFTIGNSYTRYWLPMYLGLIPFASYFIIKFTWSIGALFNIPKKINFADRHFRDKKISRKFFANTLRTVIVIVISFFSVNFVLIGSSEGLVQTAIRQINLKKEWQEVQSLTESNSTIITTYHDKLFFPERKVIVGDFSDKNLVAIYSRLAEYLPVYYYNFTFPESDIKYLNKRRLKENDLQIEEVGKMNQSFTLYKLKKIGTSTIKVGE